MKWLTPFPTFARGHAEWGACYRGWRLRAVGWPGGWRQAASGEVRSAGCWRNGGRFITQILSRKRGNLSMADDTRTTTQQRTQHAPVAPHNDSCSQLRVICDCPAVFSASSVHAGGQRRPFRHAFKSQMRSSRLPGHLKFTLALRSNQASGGAPRVAPHPYGCKVRANGCDNSHRAQRLPGALTRRSLHATTCELAATAALSRRHAHDRHVTWRAYDHCEQLEGLPHDAMPRT